MPKIRPRQEKYIWTHHVRQKMRHYRLSEPRIMRIIRYPARVEEAIVEGAVACMQVSGGTHNGEIWVLYALSGAKEKKIKIISAWRYPGTSPIRDPIPTDILKEIRLLL